MTFGADYVRVSHPRYRYMLVRDVTSLTSFIGYDYVGEWYSVGVDGAVTGRRGYMWDGPSGPTLDTRSFIRGSLAHDILYQAMREGTLTQRRYETTEYMDMRLDADRVLVELCKEDGMSLWRRQYVYWGVRIGGWEHTMPTFFFSR